MSLVARAFLMMLVLSMMAGSATAPPNTRHASNTAYSVSSFFKSPIAAFTYWPCTLCMVPGDLVMFNANGSFARGNSIVSYTWNFGDGSALLKVNSPTVNHDYFGYPGKWTVSLTVTTDDNATDSVTQQVLFNVAPSFTVHPRIPIVGLPVTFNASASKAYGPIVNGFLWSFGDGSTGLGEVVRHTYTAAGAFRVNVTMVTSGGNPTISKVIFVWKCPDVNNDGTVGIDDLVDEWTHQFTNNTNYDLDNDGSVDSTDLIFVYLNQFQAF